MIINSHAHPNTKNINKNFAMVVATGKNDWDMVANFRYFSLGIHPWFIEKHNNNDIELLEQNIKNLYPKAIGECGLDFHKNIDKELQMYFFKAQLDLAKKYNLAVIIHSVKSYDEVYNILKNYNLKIQIHAFNGSDIQGKKLLDLGCYLSFGFYKKSIKLQGFIKNIPLDKILIETDEKDNNNLEVIADEIAKLKSIKISDFIKINNDNFKNLFI